jgi:hypothetical protein
VIVSLTLIESPTSHASSIDANAFTWLDPTGQGRQATDLHITIAGTFLGPPDATAPPKSDTFPNNDFTKGVNTVTFKGNNLLSGTSDNVKFESDGNKPKPIGQFSVNNVIVPGQVHSKGLNGEVVSLGPAPLGGVLASVNVSNDFSGPLSGTLTVSINTGASSHFNLDEFDTLRPGARTLIPTTAFSFNANEGLNNIPTTFFSSDEYLLITGTANANDGFGSFPFAFAVTSPVPEPASLALLSVGILGLGWSAWRKKKRLA